MQSSSQDNLIFDPPTTCPKCIYREHRAGLKESLGAGLKKSLLKRLANRAKRIADEGAGQSSRIVRLYDLPIGLKESLLKLAKACQSASVTAHTSPSSPPPVSRKYSPTSPLPKRAEGRTDSDRKTASVDDELDEKLMAVDDADEQTVAATVDRSGRPSRCAANQEKRDVIESSDGEDNDAAEKLEKKEEACSHGANSEAGKLRKRLHDDISDESDFKAGT